MMDTLLLRKGASGPDVDKLAQALAAQLGADASAFPALQKWTRGAAIDDAFDAAIRRWQAGIGIIADGIVGPRCQVLLELAPAPGPAFEASDSKLNVARVSQLFPATKPANIARYLPYLEAALARFGLVDRATVLCALGTIRAETEGFVPIDEFQSRFNTAAGGPPYGLYDDRPSLGNKKPGDGALYKGRGFVQLTGHDNYAKYGALVGIDLVSLPQLANAPEVAAVLLASFLHSHAEAIRADVAAGDLAAARKIVNGGTHGLDQFKSVFDLAKKAFAQAAATSAAADGPATPSRRPAGGATQTSKARKDSVDLRDRQFMPAAVSLQDEFPSPQTIHEFLPAYTGAGLILNQGREGACTGFGLTCVINYLRWIKAGTPKAFESVSPRMLYTLARRHDEYEGENYEGSSCRGAIKGWFNNGVCLERHWPYAPETSNPPRYGFAEEALKTTLGVYYRVDITSVIDLQAAIAQHGAVFASAMTHTGWDETPEVAGPITGHADLPRIRFDDRMPQHSGHAFALVGFNGDGFIVQNSWGKEWGAGGFAVIQYADWLANAMDAWLVSLGVPRVVAGRLVPAKSLDGMAAAGADQSGWWDESRAYLHSIVLGNDGRVDRYVTEDEQPRNLQHQACVLPDQWFRSRPQAEPKRLVLMVHGGLNSRDDAIKRARAMGRYFLGNGCYPLFVVWQTGILESLRFLLEDQRPAADNRAGAFQFSDATDLLLEKTVGRGAARPIWNEMKGNTALAFEARRGGQVLLDALDALRRNWGERFELHVIGHSAGSIFLGHLLSALTARKPPRDSAPAKLGALWPKTVNLFAPACTVAFANQHYAGNEDVLDRLSMDILSDRAERDDNVSYIYRKSLLYFVSAALEADPRTPLLGMARIGSPEDHGWDGSSDTGETLAAWRLAAQQADLSRRTEVVDKPVNVATGGGGRTVQPASHGGFDNDIDVVSRTLARITGGDLALPVVDLRGY